MVSHYDIHVETVFMVKATNPEEATKKGFEVLRSIGADTSFGLRYLKVEHHVF